MVAVAPKPSSSPPSLVSRDAAGAAVDALLGWISAQSKHKKSQLLDHDDVIHVVLTMRKIPSQSRIKPYLIPIPHSLHTDDSAICLFVDDRSNSPVTPAAAVEKIKYESIPVSDVIGLSQIKSDYMAYEARRKLCGSYDLFFADRRILPLLPRFLGKQFFKKKKLPLAIDLSHQNWKEQLKRSLRSALLYVRTGTSCQINTGRLSLGRDAILDNVLAVVEGAVNLIPKKWKNVRSIHLKSEDSVGLPIYQALPDIGLKIDVGTKVVEEVTDIDDGGIGNGEVVQSVEEEEKASDRKVNNFRSTKKGKKVHKIRYMDNDLDNVNLKTAEVSEGGVKPEHVDESDGEERKIKKSEVKDVKKSKKGKKLKDGKRADANFDEAGLEENVEKGSIEVKKRKASGKKSEGKGKKLKDGKRADANYDEAGLEENVEKGSIEVKKRKASGKKSEGKGEEAGKKTKKMKSKTS